MNTTPRRKLLWALLGAAWVCVLASFAYGAVTSTEVYGCLQQHQACLDALFHPSPTPTPGPTPAPTVKPPATPTATPAPVPTGDLSSCNNPAQCPLGCMTSSILSGWGVNRQSIPAGTTKIWCAPVLPPYVTVRPHQIKFQLYDESDKGCGLAILSAEQTFGEKYAQTSGSPVSDGNLLFRDSWGPFSFPERTELGIYRLKVEGTGGCSTTFRVGWGVQ